MSMLMFASQGNFFLLYFLTLDAKKYWFQLTLFSISLVHEFHDFGSSQLDLLTDIEFLKIEL